MQEILLETLIDSAKAIPFLLLIYIGIELVEYRFGSKIKEKVLKAGYWGPLIGAIAGSFPQCGFSVIATALYTQRLATIGTLMAVYLATSDEAIPIILSNPESIGVVLPLILTKISIALIAGYALDLFFSKRNKMTLEHTEAYLSGKDDREHYHESAMEERACCGHNVDSSVKRFNPKEVFLHPLIHTLKIFIFIFVVSFLISFSVFQLGEETFGKIFSGSAFFQPFLAALIGLIPNCAASVAITEIYLRGLISYGSVIAGLCSSVGLGLLVLFREERSRKNFFFIVSLLFAISVFSGLLIQLAV